MQTFRNRAFSLMFGLAILTPTLLAGCGYSDATPIERIAKAQQHFDSREFRTAYIELSDLLQSHPDLLDARWLLAQVALSSGDGAKAEKEVRRALDLGKSPVEVQQALIKAILLQGELERALRESIPIADGGSPEEQASILGMRGQAAASLRRFDDAKRALDEALSLDPKSETAIIGMGLVHALQRNYDGARQLLDEHAAAIDASPEAWSLRGQIELESGNPEKAEQALTRSIELNTFSGVEYAKRALARIQLKNFPDAAEDLKVLRKGGLKDHPYVHYVTGLWHFQQGEHAQAAEAFQASETRLPGVPLTDFYLALSQLLIGNVEQALTVAERLHANLPRSRAANRLLGAAYLQKTQLDEAENVLTTALNSSPDDPAILRMLGMASLLGGKPARGVEYFQRLAAVQPESPQAEELLMLAKLMEGQDLAPDAATQLGLAGLGATGDDYAKAFLRALAAFKAGKLGEALQRAQELHKANPDKVDPINLMAACYLAAGLWDEARIELEKTLALQPNERSATLNLAKVEVQQGNLERARTLLEGLVEVRPTDETAVLQLSEVSSLLGDESGTLKLLEGSVEQVPESLGLRARLAQQYLRAGRYRDVLNLIQLVTDAQARERPNLPALRGKAEMLLGDVSAARHSFKLWTQAAPDSAEAHFFYAESLARSGNAQNAAAELTRAVQLDRNFLPARVGEIKALVHADELQKAQQALATLKKDFGDRPEVLGIEGWFALGTGDFETAERSLAGARKKNPDTESTILLVRALWGQQKHDQALAVMKDWLESRPEDVAVLMQLAGAYLILDRTDEASASYAKVVELRPNHLPALNNLAWVNREKDLALAIKHAEHAHELAPADLAVLDTYGMLLIKQGDSSRGIEMLRTAHNNAPSEPEIGLHLGKALADQGQHAEARELLKPVAEQSTNAEAAQAAKKLLEALP